ncbi:MAG: hypothetical protein H7070_16395, partial [Saprospiraceae bacterium]|nr:hypothetical protein [Pyrinomonadaceae bacterium]
YCFDVDGIKQNVQAGRLYYVGLCDNDGFIKHDTVLLNGNFYECNTDQTPSVYSTSIDKRLKKIKYNAGGVRIFGPMPY